MANEKKKEEKRVTGSEVTVELLFNRLTVASFDLPFFVKVHDTDLDIDIAQTGWSFFPFEKTIPILIMEKLDEWCPSNITNVRTTRELANDIANSIRIYGKDLEKKSVMITAFLEDENHKINDLCSLSDLFGQGGIHIGLGKVDLDSFGLPTNNSKDIIAKAGTYYIMEPVSANDRWTYGELYTNSTFKVVLTGSPKYLTKYATKESWLNAHKEFIVVRNLKDADILFTDSLSSTTEKMRKARQLGIEIKEYIK